MADKRVYGLWAGIGWCRISVGGPIFCTPHIGVARAEKRWQTMPCEIRQFGPDGFPIKKDPLTKPKWWQGVRCIVVCLALQAFLWALDVWM